MSLLSRLAVLAMFSWSAAPAPLDEAGLARAREQMVIESKDLCKLIGDHLHPKSVFVIASLQRPIDL